jgi:hypothetical protein
VYDNVEFEILPLSNFVSSDRCSTTSALLDATLSPYDEEADDRVAQAIKARSCVKRPGGHAPRPKAA